MEFKKQHKDTNRKSAGKERQMVLSPMKRYSASFIIELRIKIALRYCHLRNWKKFGAHPVGHMVEKGTL